MKKIILLVLAGIAAFNGQAAVGGPDSFGYTFIDSNEPGGPLYSWIEIATPAGGSGVLQSGVACDDCHAANIPLGFNFPYYGGSFANITIGSNGVVYFEDVYLGLSNSCMPGTPGYTMTQYNFIAHLWDDLAPNYQGGVYTQAFTDYFVIEFYDIVPCCSAGDGDTWQVILFSNGNILMQYKELSNQGVQTDFTVGIQNDPTTGLEYLCNGTGNSLSNGRAILWSAPGNTCAGTTVDLGTGPFCINNVLNAPVNAINNTWSDLSTGTTYTITAPGSITLVSLFNNGCSASATISAAGTQPTVTASASDLTPCEGENITLTGGGADSYTWDNGVTDGVAFPATAGSTVYTVTGTESVNGCTNTATVTIDAVAGPNTVANSTNLTPCEGDSIILTGSGADSYTWDNGVTDGVEFAAPSGSTVYTVTGTSTATGCSTDATITINANPLPIVNYTEINTTLCTYFSPVTLTEGTPAGGTFSGAGVTGNTFDPNQTAGTYDVTYTYTDVNNCTNFDVVTFNISECLGLVDASGNMFSVYPNPTTGTLTITGLVNGDKISLYSLDGKVLFSKEANDITMTIDLNEFANGTYVIFVNNISSQIQKK